MKAKTKNYIFWVSAFVAMFGMVAALSTAMSIYSSRQMVSVEADSLRRFAGTVAEYRLADISLTPPYNEVQTGKISKFFKDMSSDSEILSVRIWLRDGYIETGKGNTVNFTYEKPSDGILRAFDGDAKATYTFFYQDEDAQNGPPVENEKENEVPWRGREVVSERRLAVLIPLYSDFSHRVNAVFEVVKDSAAVLSPIRRVQTMIWLITILGLGFYPALLILANALYRRRKERELETIKAKQLEAVNSMIVTFNHEVNQPLTGICTYAELLRKATKDDRDLIRFADKIHEQSIRLGDLIQKISDITRVEMMEYIQGTNMVDLTKSTDKEPQTPPTSPSEPE